PHAHRQVGAAVLADLGKLRRRRGGIRVAAEENPDVALRLAQRIGLDPDARQVEPVAAGERGDQRAASAGVEAPAVKPALDLAAVEPPVVQRNAAMRAEVAQGKGATVAGAPEQDRLAEKDARGGRPRLQPPARQRLFSRPCCASSDIPAPVPTIAAARCWRWAISTGCISAMPR